MEKGVSKVINIIRVVFNKFKRLKCSEVLIVINSKLVIIVIIYLEFRLDGIWEGRMYIVFMFFKGDF